ncbi:MAG: DivIVA domain-containing protein [Clostridia bacterium]
MDNEKKFSNEMFGYDKKEVEEYIKDIKADYESKVYAEKAENNRIANELTIVKKKLDRYETDYVEKQEKVANALITAEDQAKKIIEQARAEALDERNRIEQLIEMEKEKLLDLKKDVIELREKAIKTLDKYCTQLGDLMD